MVVVLVMMLVRLTMSASIVVTLHRWPNLHMLDGHCHPWRHAHLGLAGGSDGLLSDEGGLGREHGLCLVVGGHYVLVVGVCADWLDVLNGLRLMAHLLMSHLHLDLLDLWL